MGIGGIIGSMGEISFSIRAIDDTRDGVDSAVEGLTRLETQASSTTAGLKQIAAAFATLTAMSATAVYASDRVLTLERSTGQAAITLGKTSREMYEYVQSLSSATDSQEEVGRTMDYLSRTGLAFGDDMTTVYNSLDALGDATGRTSDSIASLLIPALRSLGYEVTDVTNYIDALAYASKTTLFDMDSWSMFVRRFGEEIATYNVDLYDTIAIMAKMSELGIPQRKQMTMFTAAFREMSAGAAEVAKAEEELIKIQQELNDSQKEGAKTTRDYLEDMSHAGRNVGEMRRLTMAYNRSQRNDKEKEAELLAKQSSIQAAISKAKAAPQESLIEALAKGDPRLTVKTLTEASATYKGPEVAGAAARYQVPAEAATGSEKAVYNMDQFMQNSIGKNIGADAAAAMAHLRDISGVITGISTILALTQIFSATTAVNTGITAGTGAGAGAGAGIAGLGVGGLAMGALGGVALGGAAVYGMENAGVLGLTGETRGASVRSTGRGLMQGLKGMVPDEYNRQEAMMYLSANLGTLEERNRWGLEGRVSQADRIKYGALSAGEPIETAAAGGIVGGAPGEPRLIMAHGGETVTPMGGGGFSISIGQVNLSKDYDFPKLMRDIENYQSTKRKQSGVRTAV
jgi:hypothetical protein